MKRAFVIGHPVAHSRSPMIHTYWLERYGIEGSYEAIDVAPHELPQFFARLKTGEFAGGNVTVPIKEVAYELCDERDELAEDIGAVNTLVLNGTPDPRPQYRLSRLSRQPRPARAGLGQRPRHRHRARRRRRVARHPRRAQIARRRTDPPAQPDGRQGRSAGDRTRGPDPLRTARAISTGTPARPGSSSTPAPSA